MTQYKTLDYPLVRQLCIEIFGKYGFTSDESTTITDVLLAADLAGIESHGIQRLVRYDNAIQDGEVDIHAVSEVLHETPVSATLDAHHGMGQLVSTNAMNLAIAKAKQSGIGIVAVRNSNHYGIAGYYTRLAAAQDLMGWSMTNTEAIMVPTFGKKAMLGTNAWSVSMPADPVPFVFDAATTVVPRGKLEVYNKQAKPLPHGWVLDENGIDTTDAPHVLANIIAKAGGGILPLGGSGELNSGHKGYGFGLMVEMFTGIIAGGDTSNHAVSQTKNELAHSFWAIDYGIWGDKADIRARFSAYLDELRKSPKATGQERIYIHGEKALESAQRKTAEGIPINDVTFGEIKAICGRLGVEMTLEW